MNLKNAVEWYVVDAPASLGHVWHVHLPNLKNFNCCESGEVPILAVQMRRTAPELVCTGCRIAFENYRKRGGRAWVPGRNAEPQGDVA